MSYILFNSRESENCPTGYVLLYFIQKRGRMARDCICVMDNDKISRVILSLFPPPLCLPLEALGNPRAKRGHSEGVPDRRISIITMRFFVGDYASSE